MDSKRTLADYRPQHDEDCAALCLYCVGCGAHPHLRQPCSCGLSALLAAPPDDTTMQAALALQAETHRESQALAVAGARARAIAEVRTLLEQCSGSFVWHVIPQLDALAPSPPDAKGSDDGK